MKSNKTVDSVEVLVRVRQNHFRTACSCKNRLLT